MSPKSRPFARKVRRNVPAHLPRPRIGATHMSGPPFSYCFCHEAIVNLADVWWHLAPRVNERWLK